MTSSESQLAADSRSAAVVEAVADYRRDHQRAHTRELDFFRSRHLTDEEAIAWAARCELPAPKGHRARRHPHQYRLPKVSLAEAEALLVQNTARLRACRTFGELIDLVHQVISPIHMIGELAVYDISLRIGTRFNLHPELVYLHAGTRVGARTLGLPWRKTSLRRDELPVPLQSLQPREAEDVLCIYKNRF